MQHFTLVGIRSVLVVSRGPSADGMSEDRVEGPFHKKPYLELPHPEVRKAQELGSWVSGCGYVA